MKKLALLSSALLIATLAGYGSTIIKSKSNIANNRAAAMCHGTVTGESGHQKLTCSGACPDGKCEVRSRPDGDGGTRAWCGCTKDEPKECHVVLHTSKSGHASAECSAATPCEKSKTCKEVESKTGITCGCQ